MSSLEPLVGRQTALCELRRRIEAKLRAPPEAENKREGYGPCLLISRECGAGGGLLADMVGRRLGWQVFDREIVEEVARSAHVRCQLVESVDERVRSGWSELRRELAEGDGIGRQSYLLHLRQVILSLGHHGDVVLLGRAANYILPRECAVRVRLVAPLEIRSQRVAARESVTLHKALRRIVQTDTERAAFIREAFGRDVNAAEDYDLVLNTGHLSLEQAAEATLSKLQTQLHVAPEVPCAN